MNDSAWWWSWLLTVVGLTGFHLAGKKIWWAWYINIACQFLWFTYAIVTEQYGFIVASAAYFIVFSRNAYKWTREHADPTYGIELDYNIPAVPLTDPERPYWNYNPTYTDFVKPTDINSNDVFELDHNEVDVAPVHIPIGIRRGYTNLWLITCSCQEEEVAFIWVRDHWRGDALSGWRVLADQLRLKVGVTDKEISDFHHEWFSRVDDSGNAIESIKKALLEDDIMCYWREPHLYQRGHRGSNTCDWQDIHIHKPFPDESKERE